MVERTVKLYECGVCGKEGRRYTILADDSSVHLDRCPLHDRKIVALLEEKDAIRVTNQSRGAFKMSTGADIRLAQAQAKDKDKK